MNKITIKDICVKNKRVIVRVDFNVPLDEKGVITSDSRIKAAVPTIKYLLDQGAEKIILMSHLGRPDGKVVESMRLTPVAVRLSEILGMNVEKLDDCVGPSIVAKIQTSVNKIILLENLRFYEQEEKGDENFARQLAALADIYVNDAFGTAHRSHASTTVIAKFLPSCLGFLMGKEVQYLSSTLNPRKPYVVILGGAKVSDKIDVITNLMEKADAILIGGAMAYTFLKSKGVAIGNSRVEIDKLETAKNILSQAEIKNVKIVLPIDHLIVDNLDNPIKKENTVGASIKEGMLGVDIGMKTIEEFKKVLSTAKTVLWNGPVGIFEKDSYAAGTKAIAEYLSSLKDVQVIVGGGDSASAAKKFKVVDKLTHVSTGGGASLEFLEGKNLPGIAVIPDKETNVCGCGCSSIRKRI